MSRPHTHAGERVRLHPSMPTVGQTVTNGAHQFSKTGQTSPEVVRAVRQLVSAAMKHLTTHQQSAEDILEQLPATDENFHRYALVQQLHSLISSSLPPAVEQRLAGCPLEGDGHDTVAQITEEVLESLEYNQLFQNLTSEVKGAVEEMLSNSSLLSSSPAPQHPPLVTPSHSQTTQSFSLDASLCSDLSSLLNQTGLISPQQLLSIAGNLSPSQPLEVQIDAMHHLLQFPASDLVAMETWTELKPAISNSLLSEDSTLADLSLTLHSRLFSARTSVTTHEAYLSVTEQLAGFFQGYEGGVVTLAMGVDSADDRSLKLLQRINLLNHFQREVTSYWLRYNERVVEELVDSTFALLSLGYDMPILLSPIHFLSLVDPLAQWFQQWMHGQFSRTLVLRALRERPVFLHGVISHLMSCRACGHSHSSSRHQQHTSGFYNEHTLQFLHFAHSLSLVKRLLLYTTGRALFPVETRGQRVTITDLLVHLLQLLYAITSSHSPLTSNPSSSTHHLTSLDPAHLIIHLFQEMVSGNRECQQLLTQEAIVDTLLFPISSILEGEVEGTGVAMATLEQLGQIVASLASSESGRGSLLHTKALHTVTQFVIHCLQSEKPLVTPVVMATWLFVCRQLYKVGEGLVAMETYQLHSHIASAIRKLGLDEVRGQLGGCGFSLGVSLVDNLLSVCWSPRGQLLLQSTGLGGLCGEHMWCCIREKLQVSWCDRYGYGCLIAQLSTTPVGARELDSCGLLSSLIRDVWEVVEGGGEGGEGRRDHRLVAPWTHPLDPMDHALHKSLLRLLSVISSFPVLYELLNTTTPQETTPTATPTTLFQLLDRLVLVDSAPKQHALLGYEESHLVGVRIVSVVTTCLDSLLLLQERTGFLDALTSLQREKKRDNGEVILDACSLERNRVLVASYLVGGASERRLPPHYLTKPSEDYPWSLFTDYPPPNCYHGKASWQTAINRDSDLFKLLSKDHTPLPDQEGAWLCELRDAYWEEVKRRHTLPTDLVALLLQKFVKVQSQCDGTFSPLTLPSSHPPLHLTQSMTLGTELVVRYGVSLGLLTPPTPTPHLLLLSSLLTESQALLTAHQHPSQSTPLASLSASPPGFDWLVGSVFLLMRGQEEASWLFLQQLSSLLVSGYLWMMRLHLSTEQPLEVAYSGVHPVTYCTAHFVEMILQSEASQVFSAFQLSGCTPSQICQHWIRQCFWNFLDWPEILLYLATCVVMGTDYQVYYCVSILTSLQPQILFHAQEHDLLVFLKEESLAEFRCVEWLDHMRQLEARYRGTLLPAMRRLS